MATVPEVMAALDAQVTAVQGTEASAKTLILEFAKFVGANTTNPAALQAFVDRLNASAGDLAAAVAANPDPDPND